MDDRTADRIDRYTEYAAKARGRARAAYAAGDTHSGRFAGGQPILRGHHSEKSARRARNRSDAAMRRAIEAERAAKYWEHKANAARRREEQKHNPGVIQRRIVRLEAEQREITRRRADAKGNAEYAAQLDARADEVTAQLAENRAELAESGTKVWGKADFARGDFVFCDGMWWETKRVNARSVTVAAVVGFTHARARVGGKRVYRLADNPYDWTDTIPYTKVTGRMSAADMAARLAG
ncbi:DUF3560 domain-containing protein [Nocardiopsis sp. FR26]|uniref:DUF3560 domain-containing protein n=1 Tax=Nocardiopsis sp. FR26 TaxID=2605987 RepID=UPI00135CABF2|nr:DUF3560 domain-containing protein [Nocardiopsis sp. FR26]